MNEIELFYQQGCPYCAMAKKAAEELAAEDPAYGALPVRWIDERRESALANARDYYYVPSVFYRGEKLFEARPSFDYETIRAGLRSAFDRALGR